MPEVSYWQDFLSCYRQHFEIVRADTPSLLDEAYRLRYQVYCVEKTMKTLIDRRTGGRQTFMTTGPFTPS
jgi:hypothetical protein